jgi:hypothetical protein
VPRQGINIYYSAIVSVLLPGLVSPVTGTSQPCYQRTNHLTILIYYEKHASFVAIYIWYICDNAMIFLITTVWWLPKYKKHILLGKDQSCC